MRKSYNELKDIMSNLNVDKLWSWSRMNSYHTSRYEYYLKYIKREKEKNPNSVYLTMGNIVHEILEDLYTDKIEYDEMSNIFNNLWTMGVDVLGLKFDRNDSEKNANIKSKYFENLKLFFKYHQQIKYKTALEQFVLTKITDNIYFQGYVDCLFKDDDNIFNIVDFKTSTIYKNEKKDNECGQLVLYAMYLMQKGIPVDKIKISWLFIKYLNVTTNLKNGNVKIRQIERAKLGKDLISNATMWLKNFGYKESEIDSYIANLVSTNDIDCLPDEVKNKYIIEDCYVYVELNEELINKWKEYIISTISEIETKDTEFTTKFDEKIYWDNDEDLKKQGYYFANLSGYTINQNKCLKEYLERMENCDNLLNQTSLDHTFDWLNGI